MEKVKRAAGVFLPSLAGAAYALALARAGAGAAGLLLFWFFAVCGVWLPGRVLAGLCGAEKQGLLQTVSLVSGACLLAAVTVAASATGLHSLVWLLPVLGLAGLVVRRREFHWRGRRGSAWPAAVWVALLALAAFGCVLANAHPASVWGGGAVLPDHDFYWDLGNVQSFLRGFPPGDLRFAGTQLTYHWLTELLAAGFAMAGVPAYDVLAFYLPAAVLAALLAVLAEFGRVWFGGSEKKARFFVLLTFLGGSAALWKALAGRDPFWNLLLRHLVTNVNGMATGFLFLAAFAAAVAVLSKAGEAGLGEQLRDCAREAPPGESPEGEANNAGPAGACGRTQRFRRQAKWRQTPTSCSSPAAPGTEAVGRRPLLALWGQKPPLWLGGLALGSFAALTLAKGPVGGVAALALLCAAAVFLAGRLARREDPRRALAILALALCVLAVFAVCYKLLFSAGAGTSVHFSARGTLEKSYFKNFLALLKAHSGLAYAAALPLFALAQTVCFAPFAALLGFGGAVRDTPRVFRLPLPRLFATAMAAGGFLAFFLFDHEAMSQMYFAFAGLFFLNVLAVENAGPFLDWLRQKGRWLRAAGRAALALLLAVSLATGLCTCVWMIRDGASRQTASDWDLPLTAAEEAAMAWLGENGGEFLTNRIHTGKAREGLSNVYSGLSGQQGYMEGFKYAVSNMGVPLEEVLHRLDVLELVFGAGTAAEARRAVPPGVRYIVYSKRAAQAGWDVMEGRDEPFFRCGDAAESLPIVFENDDVSIYFVSEKTEDLP